MHLGRQWDLFWARGNQTEFTLEMFVEGLWEMSLRPALGPVDTDSRGCAAQGEDELSV